MAKAPEWLDDDIREFYPLVNGEIRAIQRAITERRGTEPKYMTITDHMKRLGLERPRDKSKKAPKETPMHVDDTPVEVLPNQMDLDTDTPPQDTVSVSTIVDMVPVNGRLVASLSPVEVQTLEHYEQIIAQGMQTFVEVGHALLAIREQRLYRQSYETFEDYLRQRWDLSRPRAYQLIDAAQVIDTVSTIVDIVPVNEAQARPLTSLPPEQQAEVWREAVDTAPAGKVTAKHVQETVKRVKGSSTVPKMPKPKAPEPSSPVVPRKKLQDGLFAVLCLVKDTDAWPILRELAQALDTYADDHAAPDLQQRIEQALSPMWALIDAHDEDISHSSEV